MAGSTWWRTTLRRCRRPGARRTRRGRGQSTAGTQGLQDLAEPALLLGGSLQAGPVPTGDSRSTPGGRPAMTIRVLVAGLDGGVTVRSARRRGPEGFRAAAGQRPLDAAQGRAVFPPVQHDPDARSLRVDGGILRGDPKVAAPVCDAVRQVGCGDILASADALEQAIALARNGMPAVNEKPGNR